MEEFKNDRKNRKRKNRLRVTIISIIIFLAVGSAIGYGMREEKVTQRQMEKEEKAAKKEGRKDEKKQPEEEEEAAKKAEKEKKEDETALVKGSNHIKKADSYAYDAETVSEYIRPQSSPGAKSYDGGRKICFLTFDDGPNHEMTPKILDILKEKGVHATFFVPGHIVGGETKDLLERQLKEGHALALHSFTHQYDLLYPGRSGNTDRIIEEAKESVKAFQDTLGEDFYPGVWRYPGGHMSWDGLEDADQRLNDMNIAWIDWNCLTGDAEPMSRRPQTKEEMVDFTFDSIKYFYEQELVVCLMHDSPDKALTAEALPDIIDGFRERGYEFGILK